jgi:hypothetical protein
LLDQLGILLQRLISLESWNGDMRDHPRSISRKPWAAYLGLPYYGTKNAPQKFPWAPNLRPESNRRILLTRREKHNDARLWVVGQFPISVNQDLPGFNAAMPGRHRFSRLA